MLLQNKSAWNSSLGGAVCFTLAAILWSAPCAASADYQFAYSGSYVEWSVPATGFYDITAIGAAGGAIGSIAGGAGAQAFGGHIALRGGQILTILVGGAGGNGAAVPAGVGAGGGGGTFVALGDLSSPTPLVVAGGGGGGGSGGSGFGGGSGGGGAGGLASFYGNGGGGGGGFFGIGGWSQGFSGGEGGMAFIYGGSGGGYGGGFGGGGGGGASDYHCNPFDGCQEGYGGGGGGGGYQGGDGGAGSKYFSNGGADGTSYVTPDALFSSFGTGSGANGFVDILLESPAPAAGAGLLSLATLIVMGGIGATRGLCAKSSRRPPGASSVSERATRDAWPACIDASLPSAHLLLRQGSPARPSPGLRG